METNKIADRKLLEVGGGGLLIAASFASEVKEMTVGFYSGSGRFGNARTYYNRSS